MGMTSGENVKYIAKKLNISIREVERRAGLSNGTIGNWESSAPKASSLNKVAKALRVPIELLLADDDAEEQT